MERPKIVGIKLEKEKREEKIESVSFIKKIVGGTEEERKKAEKKMAKEFAEQTETYKELKKRGIEEIKKSLEQIEAIDFFKEITKDLFKIKLPHKNIHILEEESYNELFKEEVERKTLAEYVPLQQAIFTRETGSFLRFFKRVLHEAITANSYQEIEVLKNKECGIKQLGIFTKTLSGKECFKNLYEGIVEELVKKLFYERIAGNPNLPKVIQQEIDWSQERKIELLSKIGQLSKTEIEGLITSLFPPKNAQSLKEKFNKPSIVEIEELKNAIRDIFSIQMPSVFPRDKEDLPYELFSYSKERKILNRLVRKLYAKNPGEFKEEDGVRELFFQSIFTGKFEWKELVEKTFGKGMFEKLGESDKNPDELEKFVNGL